MFDELLTKFGQADALRHQLLDHVQSCGHVPLGQAIDQRAHRLATHRAQDFVDLGERHRFRAEAEHLIEEADGVAHAALGAAGNGRQGIVLGLKALFAGDEAQVGCDFGHGNAAEVEALTPAQNCGRNFVGFGRGQYKAGMGRRLFQRL